LSVFYRFVWGPSPLWALAFMAQRHDEWCFVVTPFWDGFSRRVGLRVIVGPFHVEARAYYE